MRYSIDDAIFDMFPQYCRGVVVAHGFDNSTPVTELTRMLDEETGKVAADPSVTASTHPKLTPWQDAYRRLGANPSKETPSICFLVNQVKAGKRIRSISPIVDIFNIFSLRLLIPCGGDDLLSLEGGDLKLCFATGSEVFSPLFKPTAIEHPVPGEVIYMTPQTNRVLCRRWNWRNADFSKILPQTANVVINLDAMLPHISRDEVAEAAIAMAALIQTQCGGNATSTVLDRNKSSLEI